MIKSYRAKLLISYFLIISVVLLMASGITYIIFKDRYLHDMEERLVQEALLIADMAKYRIGDNAYQDIANIAAQDTKTRVTIIDREGQVLGDSEIQPSSMDKHRSRPEVYTALQGGTGVAMRYSDTVRMNFLYVAVPFENEQVAGAIRLAMPLAQLQFTNQQILFKVLLASLACILLAFLLSLIVTKHLARPLREMTEAINDVASGDLRRRIPHYSNDELGELAVAFNMMAEQIGNNITEISSVNNRLEAILGNTVNGIIMINQEGIVTYANPVAASLLDLGTHFLNRKYIEIIRTYDLMEMVETARKDRQAVKRSLVLHTLGARIIEATVLPIKSSGAGAEDILLVLNDVTELKRLEKVRKEFVANVSHELKTPVSSISGFAETLMDEAGADADNVKEFSRIIYSESQRLSRLINDLLELSQLESEEGRAQYRLINIDHILQESTARMSAISTLHNINIDYVNNMSSNEIYSDPNLIEQVVTNLLDNAIKFTPQGGQIIVQLDDLGNYIKISVQDNGIGIPAQDISRIFERFYRVDKARSRKTGGTGLGLSIVKHAVDKLNGQVTVESNEGIGTTFYVTLPK